MELRGQRALITGGSRGIGRSVALRLAADGCDLALVARRPETLAATRAECEALGVRCVVVSADLGQDDGPEAALRGCLDGLGGCNLLIHAAGVISSAPAQQASWQDWDAMLQLNLRASMHLTKLALPHLTGQKNATIVFVASVCAKVAVAGLAGYCASKHGIVAFANALFEDVRGLGIKVSSICPGYVNTDMLRASGIDGRQVIQPEAVADTVRFVVGFPSSGCPTEIVIRSQQPPYA